MSRQIPVRVDAFRLAERSVRHFGVLPLQRMQRLQSAASRAEGNAECDLVFSHSRDGGSQLSGSLQADIELICQRCMQPFVYSISTDFCFKLVEHEVMSDDEFSETETLLVPEGMLDIVTFVEDELLLSIPVVPSHNNEKDCDEWVQQVLSQQATLDEEEGKVPADQDENPFAVLASLKKH